MNRKKIEDITSQILTEFNSNELPIPIKKIAERLGIKIHTYDLGDNISGVLVINQDQGFIGINPKEPSVRQRFTMAHELGHFLLHKNSSDSIFIDKEYKVLFRDQKSATGENKREQEANAFAASILMPRKLLIEQIQNHFLDLTDEVVVKQLAKMFDVSVIAMTIRISNLSLF
ncbi:MAG: ImmA/IrrE family metallo-endopeptidase [Bacteroidia bacterium]|nr:ImmA/IrrE family metallo-endopeptidase [Bacteroidia bacterium]